MLGRGKEGEMRRTFAVGIFAVVAMVAARAGAPAPQGAGGSSHTVTKAQYESWKKDLSNWGRWG